MSHEFTSQELAAESANTPAPTVSHGLDNTLLSRRNFLKTGATLGAVSLLASLPLGMVSAATKSSKAAAAKPAAPEVVLPLLPVATGAAIEPIDFKQRLSTVDGMTPTQIEKHLGLYQGYVKKLNTITEKLAQFNPADLSDANITYHGFRELHVEQTFALNGTVLHELYFENIGGEKKAPSDTMRSHLTEYFGGWDTYLAHLLAAGKSSRGWVMTAVNHRDGKIHNYTLDAHNQTVPFYVTPLVVLDVYEHAYMIDFATNRAAYLDVFVKNIDWSVAERRLKLALHNT